MPYGGSDGRLHRERDARGPAARAQRRAGICCGCAAFQRDRELGENLVQSMLIDWVEFSVRCVIELVPHLHAAQFSLNE